MIIFNNEKLHCCPCCNSKLIHKVGNVSYSNKTTYSNIRVSLSDLPELWECGDCDSWFIQNRIFENDAYMLYSKGNSWLSGSFEESKSTEVIKILSKLISNTSNILDVGCSNGAFLDYARLQRVDTYGLEYSVENFHLLNNKGHKSYLKWDDVDNCFDIITAFDVVEHLYHIHQFLDQCYIHLRPAGKLVIISGNNQSWPAISSKQDWWYLRHPEHIVFPSINFYKSLESFTLISADPVYPYKFWPKNISYFAKSFKLLKSGIKNLVYRSCFPFPILPPDHFLVILEKR